MTNGHLHQWSAAGPDFGPLLVSLLQGQVQFVVVGPAAARARGVDLSSVAAANGCVLDITPEPSINNLRLLAVTLTHPLNALLHTAGMPPGLPLSFGASLFSAIPTLPLITTLGPLTVRLQSPSSPPTYQDLLSDASETELDGVTIQAPTTKALLRSLSDRITVRLDAPAQPPAAHEHFPMSLAGQSPPEHGTLSETEPEELVLSALANTQGPLSIREILLRAPSGRKPPYKRVKAAAETLTDRGELDRAKEGTAHRYALRTDTDDQIARRIRALLTNRANPQAILQAALTQREQPCCVVQAQLF